MLAVQYNGEPQLFEENLTVFGIVLNGSGALRVNGLEFDISEGNLLQLHDHHIYMIESHSPLSVLYIPIGINSIIETAMLMDRSAGEAFFNKCLSPVIALSPENAAKAKALYAQADQLANDEYARAERLAYVFAAHSLESLPLDGLDDSKSVKLGWRIYNYITTHFAEDLNEEAVAQMFDCIPQEVNYHLRKACSYNLKTLLSRLRARCAVMTYYFTPDSLSELAKNSGFKSVSIMYKAAQNLDDYDGLGIIEFVKRKFDIPSAFNQNFPTLMAYISTNFREDISLESAADMLHVKVRSLKAMLEGLNIPPFFELVRYLRINYAVNLLQVSDRTVLDIALDSGYNSINTFFNHFKQSKSCSPSEYRTRFNSA